MSDQTPPPPPSGATPPPPPSGGFSSAAPPPPVAPPPTGYGPPPQDKNNALAITALVTGILGAICCAPLAIVALITGLIGRSQISSNPGQRGMGMAIAGIVLGVIGIVGWIIIFVWTDGSFYFEIDS